MDSLLTIQASYLSFITFMDKHQSHQQHNENSSVLHSKVQKPGGLQQKSNFEKIMPFSIFKKGLTFLSLIRFTSGRHVARLLLLYALSVRDVHWLPIYRRAYRPARFF